MNACIITFGTIRLRCESDSRPFIDFVRNYFQGTAEIAAADHQITINFLNGWSWKKTRERSSPEAIILGEGIAYDKKRMTLAIAYHELTGAVSFGGESVNVDVSFQRIAYKHVANWLLFKRRGLSEHYFRFICRFVIQNILFMLMCRKKEGEVLSAAAIVYRGRAFVFAGLPGSGKTTAVTTLKRAMPGVEIAAQNYAIFKNNMLRPFTEGLSVCAAGTYPIERVFIVAHGPGFESRDIAPSDALARLRFINDATAELPRHSRLGALALVDSSWQGIMDDDELAALARTVPVTELVTDQGFEECLRYFIAAYGQDR